MTTDESRPAAAPALAIDWRVVLRGALVGLAVIVPVTVLRVVLDREISDFDDSGWVYPLFVLILIGYAASGWVAGRARPDSPLTHGALAGIGVLVLWIPIRIVIWAVREDGRGLVSGDNAITNNQTNASGEKTTAYVGAGVLGTLGAAANTASGGVLASVGEWLGGKVYDLTHDEPGEPVNPINPWATTPIGAQTGGATGSW